MVPQNEAEYAIPARVGDCADFFSSIHHATNVGKLFRPDNPLLPNYRWVPIGYHGRASSIGISGESFRRPMGQSMSAGAQRPEFGPSKRLDYELELGIYVGTGNTRGNAIAIGDAEAHCLACACSTIGRRATFRHGNTSRWPFLSKNFANHQPPTTNHEGDTVNKLKLFATVLVTGLSMADASAQSMRLAHGLPDTHPVHQAMQRFADTAKQKTKGEVDIKIFANGTLGGERETLEQVQNGILELTKASASPLETFAPEYKVFNLPFVFRDKEHFFKVLDGPIGESILAASKSRGFIGLTFYDAGARSFYAKKAINSPDDLKGLKIRVQQSPTTIKMIQALGAAPTPMPYGEVYSALQSGVVDGAENNITALTTGRHGEVSKFYSQTEHQMVPDVLVISVAKWDSLKKPAQDALREAARESFVFQRKLWADTEKTEMAAAEKLGVKISSPNKQAFAAKVKPMIDEERKNAKVAGLLDQIAATK